MTTTTTKTPAKKATPAAKKATPAAKKATPAAKKATPAAKKATPAAKKATPAPKKATPAAKKATPAAKKATAVGKKPAGVDALKPSRGSAKTKVPPKGDSKALALAIVEAAWARNAFDTRILDIREVASYADMLVILSGRSDRQVSAIATEIEKTMKSRGVQVLGVEGRSGGTWILLDFGSVVVHVFEKQTRLYYDLEKLWSEGTEIPVTEPVWVQEFARIEGGDADW